MPRRSITQLREVSLNLLGQRISPRSYFIESEELWVWTLTKRKGSFNRWCQCMTFQALQTFMPNGTTKVPMSPLRNRAAFAYLRPYLVWTWSKLCLFLWSLNYSKKVANTSSTNWLQSRTTSVRKWLFILFGWPFTLFGLSSQPSVALWLQFITLSKGRLIHP